MRLDKKYVRKVILLILILTQTGCSLLQVPNTVVGGTFSLLGKLLKVVERVPKPPPGVFF